MPVFNIFWFLSLLYLFIQIRRPPHPIHPPTPNAARYCNRRHDALLCELCTRLSVPLDAAEYPISSRVALLEKSKSAGLLFSSVCPAKKRIPDTHTLVVGFLPPHFLAFSSLAPLLSQHKRSTCTSIDHITFDTTPQLCLSETTRTAHKGTVRRRIVFAFVFGGGCVKRRRRDKNRTVCTIAIGTILTQRSYRIIIFFSVQFVVALSFFFVRAEML